MYDLFHVVAKYGREVIDRVRVDEANRLQARQAGPAGDQGRPLAAAAQPREPPTRGGPRPAARNCWPPTASWSTVYVLKDDLKDLWDYRHAGYARRFWQRLVPPGDPQPHRAAQALRPQAARLRSTASWPTAAGRCTPACWKASTTRSRSSNAWPTASATTTTSSSRSVRPSPEIRDEPNYSGGGKPKHASCTHGNALNNADFRLTRAVVVVPICRCNVHCAQAGRDFQWPQFTVARYIQKYNSGGLEGRRVVGRDRLK